MIPLLKKGKMIPLQINTIQKFKHMDLLIYKNIYFCALISLTIRDANFSDPTLLSGSQHFLKNDLKFACFHFGI